MSDRELLKLAAKAAGMVNYNPNSGLMLWKPKPETLKDSARWNARYANKECGTIDDKGYRRILYRFCACRVFRIRTHRLAWLITYGKLPDGEIDHINQNKADNRIVNLRDVSKEINQRNGTRKSNNTSGVPGVTWHKQHQKWYAQANTNVQHHSVGLFLELSEAETAVKNFRAQHVFTETHGRAK